MVELVEVEYLDLTMSGLTRRPWEVSVGTIESVRRLFPMWLKERHGIVVYKAALLDSSAGRRGDLTFMPRMYEAQDDSMQPAPKFVNPGGLASTTAVIVGWVWIGPEATDEGIISLIDSCFYYEDEDRPTEGKPTPRTLMSGEPCSK